MFLCYREDPRLGRCFSLDVVGSPETELTSAKIKPESLRFSAVTTEVQPSKLSSVPQLCHIQEAPGPVTRMSTVSPE